MLQTWGMSLCSCTLRTTMHPSSLNSLQWILTSHSLLNKFSTISALQKYVNGPKIPTHLTKKVVYSRCLIRLTSLLQFQYYAMKTAAYSRVVSCALAWLIPRLFFSSWTRQTSLQQPWTRKPIVVKNAPNCESMYGKGQKLADE